MYKEMMQELKNSYLGNAAITITINKMASAMTEAKMNKEILTKVGDLTSNITKSFANAFSIDSDKIAGALKLKMSQEEITRIIS